MRSLGQRYFLKSAFYLTVLLLLSANSCSGPDVPDLNANLKVEVEHLDKAIQTLDTGINTLGKESGSWRKTLEDVRDKTAADIQSTIKTEITNLIDHGVSVIGQESRCNVDFVAKRSRFELIRIKNELIAKRNELAQKIGISPIPLSTIPAVTPAICIVSPSSLDLTTPPDRRNKIDISGYDFDSAPIVVMLRNSDQEIDVTRYLAKPSPLNMSLNLGGNGVPLSSNSQMFILKVGENEISSINIIAPPAPPPPPDPNGVFSRSSLKIGDTSFSINNSGTILTKTQASTGKWLGEQKFQYFGGMMWVAEHNVLFVAGVLDGSKRSVLVKIKGTGGGGRNMFALTSDGGSVSGYNYRLGSQFMNVQKMNYRVNLQVESGSTTYWIKSVGGTGYNMFALVGDTSCQSVSGYSYFIECTGK